MTYPDERIEPEYHDKMNMLAHALDETFNGELRGKDRITCFVLLTCHFNEMGRANYISNGKRSDVIVMLKELLARFEGQPEVTGKA